MAAARCAAATPDRRGRRHAQRTHAARGRSCRLRGSLGFGIALLLVVRPLIRTSKEDRTKTEPSLPPENDAEAAAWAIDVLEGCYEKFYDAFSEMSDEDRRSNKGAQIAHVCDRIWKAHEQMEDAWEVSRGTKIVTLADPETRATTQELIEMIEEFDLPVVVGPKAFDPKPTHH